MIRGAVGTPRAYESQQTTNVPMGIARNALIASSGTLVSSTTSVPTVRSA